MSYTSGRTVKSSKATKSPIQLATAEARKLVRRHIPAGARPTVETARSVDADLTVRLRTVVTFPEGTDAAGLAADIADLPRYHSMAWNSCSISYLTDLEG